MSPSLPNPFTTPATGHLAHTALEIASRISAASRREHQIARGKPAPVRDEAAQERIASEFPFEV